MFADTNIVNLPLNSMRPQSISHFSEGSVVELYAVSGQKPLCKRLESMGLLPGKHITILKNKGQGLLLKTEHTRLALRLSSAFLLEAVLAPV